MRTLKYTSVYFIYSSIYFFGGVGRPRLRKVKWGIMACIILVFIRKSHFSWTQPWKREICVAYSLPQCTLYFSRELYLLHLSFRFRSPRAIFFRIMHFPYHRLLLFFFSWVSFGSFFSLNIFSFSIFSFPKVFQFSFFFPLVLFSLFAFRCYFFSAGFSRLI